MESYGHRTNDIILEWKEDVPIRISDKVMNELIYSRFSKIKLSLHTITNAKISPWTLKNLKEKKDILKESFSCLRKIQVSPGHFHVADKTTSKCDKTYSTGKKYWLTSPSIVSFLSTGLFPNCEYYGVS